MKSIYEIFHTMFPKMPEKKYGNSVTFKTCPFCKGTYKFNINISKNVYRCAKCDEHGNTLYFVRRLYSCSKEEALKKLETMDVAEFKPEDIVKENEAAMIKERTMVYEILSNVLPLKKEHEDNLLKRGLSKEKIRELGIVSYDKELIEKVTKPLLQFTKNKCFIPGLFNLGETLEDEGIMIPVRTRNGYISTFQIRHSKGKTRYTNYSSRCKQELGGCSTSGCENIHYVGFPNKKETPKVVSLTEGCLKADVASYLAGNKPFIAVLGVNNTSQLHDELTYLRLCGTETINICLDMDYREKKEVSKALEKIKKLIVNVGLQYRLITWDSNYKGIDDYLLSTKRRKKV